MNGALLLVLSGVVLVIAYFTYGRYLERKWGIDENRPTPAFTENNDKLDYAPASKIVMLGHQFASIAGAGPINGPIIAAMFGWGPVLAWILVGGIFFGAVQDFATLYASVRNRGKTISVIIDKYVGRNGRVLFLSFVWLFCVLVIAAFVDIVATTLDGVSSDPVANKAGASAATSSVAFIVFAFMLGLSFKMQSFSQKAQTAMAVASLIASILIGLYVPFFASKSTWMTFTYVYIFAASVLPVWALLQPRDFLNSFLLFAMLIVALVGVVVAQPTIELPAFTGLSVDGMPLFPILFVTVACGAISGFHALASSGTTSKQISNEKDMKLVAYGGMLFECFLAIIALIAVGSLATANSMPEGSPPEIFAKGLANFLLNLGMSEDVVYSLIVLAISAFALTTLDSVTRIARLTLQELFVEATGRFKILQNSVIATVVTLLATVTLAIGGYERIWPLFGTANQLLAALALIAVSVFLKRTGKSNTMIIVPIFIMLCVTFSSLAWLIYHSIESLLFGFGDLLTVSVQLTFELLLFGLGAIVAWQSVSVHKEPQRDEIVDDVE